MKRIEGFFALALIFACAIVLTTALIDAASVEAREPPQALSRRPGGGDEQEPLPPEDLGLVIPGQGGEDKPVRDPGKPGFTAIFPKGSLTETVRIRFFDSGFPEGVPPLPNVVGSPFCFGAWSGEGVTVCPFNLSILVNVSYDDSGLLSSQEERLSFYMYDPPIKSWVKLGGWVDIYKNVATGILISSSPLEVGGNTLFALAVDEAPPLEQAIDEFGKTTLSIKGRPDFRFRVLPGTVEAGTHFEVTPLADTPGTNSFKLINSLDIRAYKDNSQVTGFLKPLSVEFDYDAALAGAGDQAKLTIVALQNECQNGGWVEAEELGYKVTRQGSKLTVEADKPGTFGLAVKQ
jgi:hypothetical protein